MIKVENFLFSKGTQKRSQSPCSCCVCMAFLQVIPLTSSQHLHIQLVDSKLCKLSVGVRVDCLSLCRSVYTVAFSVSLIELVQSDWPIRLSHLHEHWIQQSGWSLCLHNVMICVFVTWSHDPTTQLWLLAGLIRLVAFHFVFPFETATPKKHLPPRFWYEWEELARTVSD